MYKRQAWAAWPEDKPIEVIIGFAPGGATDVMARKLLPFVCLLYTSDAADERSSVDLGGRRIIQKKKHKKKQKIKHILRKRTYNERT